MIKNILTEPEPILRQKGRDISPDELGTPKLEQLTRDLIATMYAKDGVGIAAPQIGQSVQICAIAREHTPEQKSDLVLINPVWIKKSLIKVSGEEGCLSVPDVFGKVKRYKKIKVTALDPHGKKLVFEAANFPARVIQHEVDHLNGILFIDKAKDIYRTDNLL
ncbi:MAG: peptide deformylase [Patescibacteria group bacterium]|nr:peptide deformylase [Patescibacteria group bacterium]